MAREAPPPFLPTRDAAATYRVRDERGRTAELLVAWSAAARALRAEALAGDAFAALGGVPLPPGARLVLDLRAGRAFAAEDRTGITLDMPRIAEEARRGQRVMAQARYHRIGTGHVAGLPCTEWRVQAPTGAAADEARPWRICLTADGVPLRAQEEGRTARAEALAVDYRSQDTARFAPPRSGLGAGAGEVLGRALQGMVGGDGSGAGALDAIRGLFGPRP